MTLTIVIGILLMIGTRSQASIGDPETVSSLARCEIAIREVEQEDRATIEDDSPTRLYSTWLSEQCEARAGPEYIIRKYTFFKNGTFLLLRHHYVEESCSIPIHTVVIRGSIKLLAPSAIVPGATETRFHVDTVYIIPLNQQVAHKFGHRLNLVCGPQPKWRPYVPQLIYEQLRQHSATAFWHGPIYNSLQSHSPMKKRFDSSCLEPFGIEFDELRLLRVQKKLFGSKYVDAPYRKPRFELFLGSFAPNAYSRRSYKPTSLQSTVMVRADTATDCLICSSVSRGTEFSPPLLHEAAALPALIGGSWLSDRCESYEGGIWSKRQLHIHSGDKLWTGRWDYYDDPQCSVFLYAVTAAGSYVQRRGRQRRHEEFDEGKTLLNFFLILNTSAKSLLEDSRTSTSTIAPRDLYASDRRNSVDALYHASRNAESNADTRTDERSRDDRDLLESPAEGTKAIDHKIKRTERSLTDSIYQHLHDAQSSMVQSRLMAMLRGHQSYETSTKRPSAWSPPSGTTKLDLHVAESILIPGDAMVSARCGADQTDVILSTWPRNCVPRAVEAPSTLGLRTKLAVNWDGQYILLLGRRDDDVWEAPLRQCAQIPLHNPVLRAHLRRSVGLRFGLLSSATSTRITRFLLPQLLLCCLYYVVR